ncbi:MAG: type II secretion system F family protein [Clostridia bacterium]|nr:type II secretion system F family protein [Clostridia bacterium]
MKKFKYKAVNLYGKKFNGIFLAENEQDLREQLAKQNLYLVSSKAATDKTPNAFFSTTGKVSVNELSTFCRQFAIMLNSGTSIIDTLEILRTQAFSKFFCKTLDMVFEDVKAGLLLSEAMAKHKKIFPDFFRSMVRVGEISGALDEVMVSVADYYESDSKMKSALKSAMIYPTILIIMAIGIIVLLVVFVIPTFIDAFSSIDVEMPKLTLVLYDVSQWIIANWMILILAIVAVIALWMLFLHTTKGRYLWDKCKFHMPLVGNIIENTISSRFCRAFSLLVASGMDIVDAMDEMAVVLGNKYVAEQFKKATEDVRQGMTLTMALQSYKLFPTMLIQMISIGERTGELESVLNKSTSFFENQVQRSIASVTSVIQPVILLIIGGSVGLLFYAVYSPMLSIMNTL